MTRTVTRRLQWIFFVLIAAQALHSTEEYLGRLYEGFPPARFVSSLFSSDLQRGFFIANALLLLFGLWCCLWPIRLRWPSARTFAWGWAIVESINGAGHLLRSLLQGAYTPGVLTAPLLLLFAILLIRELLRSESAV